MGISRAEIRRLSGQLAEAYKREWQIYRDVQSAMVAAWKEIMFPHYAYLDDNDCAKVLFACAKIIYPDDPYWFYLLSQAAIAFPSEHY